MLNWWFMCFVVKTMLVLCSTVMDFVQHITDADALTQAGEAAKRRRSQSRPRRSSHSHGDPNITSCYESEDKVMDTQCKIIGYMACAKRHSCEFTQIYKICDCLLNLSSLHKSSNYVHWTCLIHFRCSILLCSMYCVCVAMQTHADGLIQAGEVARRRRSQSCSRRSSRSSCELPPPLVEPNIRSCHTSDDQQTPVDAQCKFVVVIIILNFSFASQEFFPSFCPYISMLFYTLSLLLPSKVHVFPSLSSSCFKVHI